MDYPAVHIENDKHFCDLISQLLREADKSSVERLLLDIQDYVIANYALRFPSGILHLMELEIYYTHKQGTYEGQSTHKDDHQSNRCGMLYDHGKGGTRKGFDIVLSMGNDYFLSCLVKGSVHEGNPLFKQGVSYSKCQELAGVDNLSEYPDPVLVKIERTDGVILHSKRVGLTSDKDKDAILRSLNCSYFGPQSDGFNLLYKYKGYNKTDFLLAELILRNVTDKEAAEALSREILGYVAKSSIEDSFRKE